MADAHITLVIDRSGSMQSTREDAQGGLDSFVSEFVGDSNITISLWEFDSEIEEAVAPVVASAWPGYTLTPRGSTALLDAMGKAIKATKKHIKEHPAEKVVVAVVTDGGENASRQFTKEQVTGLIDRAKTKGWEFVFLASDLSAIETGERVGMPTSYYAPAETSMTHSVLRSSVSSYVRGETGSVEWDAEMAKARAERDAVDSVSS